MGQITELSIKAWQDEAGIVPATGQYAEALEELSQAAFSLIKIIELERSGIRDGDGGWHGGDVLGGIAHDINVAFDALRWAVPQLDAAKETALEPEPF
jgi:hypothetical protein